MKTEKPTPHRLLKESRKGKSFVSKDLAATALLLCGGLALAFATSAAALRGFYQGLLARDFNVGIAEAGGQALKAFLWLVVPVAVACIAGAVVISLVQSRGVIANEALKIDLARLNPVAGFRNLFSMKSIKGLVSAMLYLLLAAAFVLVAWQTFAPVVFAQVHLSVPAAIGIWRDTGWKAVALLLAMLSPVALGTAFVEYRLYIRELRMDKSEVKQENKDHNGNPEIKQRRRQINDELSAQVQSDVGSSTMILANPTHFAVGIYVHDDYPGLQFISVREKGARARAVVALAEKLGVPVVRDVPLTRAVYAGGKRYRFVSGALVEPIGRVLQWLRDIERLHAPQAPTDEGDVTPPSP